MKLYESPEEYRQTSKRQRAIAVEIADKLASGAVLDDASRGFAAAILREWSVTHPLDKPRTSGQPPQFCHASAAMMYANKRAKGVPETEAADLVADDLGVTRTAVVKAIKPYGEEIAAMMKTYSRK